MMDSPYNTSVQNFSNPGQLEKLLTRLAALRAEITMPYPLVLSFVVKHENDGGCAFLRIGDPTAICNVTGGPLPWWGRKWYVSPHMTDGEIVQTVFLAIRTAQEHELREQFKFKGMRVFDPHYDIHNLIAFIESSGIAATSGREGVPFQ